MILKMRSAHGWAIVPDIGFIEYSNAESKRMGFYEIEAPGFMNFNIEVPGKKTLVPVIKSPLPDEDLYYPNDDIIVIKSSDYNTILEKVRVNGRSKHEVAHDDNEDDIHTELVTFMSWLCDELGRIYLFNDAYLLNDHGDTIEHIL